MVASLEAMEIVLHVMRIPDLPRTLLIDSLTECVLQTLPFQLQCLLRSQSSTIDEKNAQENIQELNTAALDLETWRGSMEMNLKLFEGFIRVVPIECPLAFPLIRALLKTFQEDVIDGRVLQKHALRSTLLLLDSNLNALL